MEKDPDPKFLIFLYRIRIRNFNFWSGTLFLCLFYFILNRRLGEAKASGNLGNTLKVMGKFEEAVICCRRHLEICRWMQSLRVKVWTFQFGMMSWKDGFSFCKVFWVFITSIQYLSIRDRTSLYAWILWLYSVAKPNQNV